MDNFFGYSWDDIQAMQQKRYKPRGLPRGTLKPEATQEDIALLRKCGAEGLARAQLYGVMDRLRTSGLLAC